MTQKAIGPTFAAELQAAGLTGLPFSWDAAGDIVFSAAMTTAQIAAVEAVYAAHDPTAISLPDAAAAAMAAGLTVTSTSTPSLDGTYAIADQNSRLNILSQMVSIATTGKFTTGDVTIPWFDMGSPKVPHVFTAVQFKALAIALGAYYSTLEFIVLTGSGTLPAATAVIA